MAIFYCNRCKTSWYGRECLKCGNKPLPKKVKVFPVRNCTLFVKIGEMIEMEAQGGDKNGL